MLELTEEKKRLEQDSQTDNSDKISELTQKIDELKNQIREDAQDIVALGLKTSIDTTHLGTELAQLGATFSAIVSPALLLGSSVVSAFMAGKGIYDNARQVSKLNKEIEQLDLRISRSQDQEDINKLQEEKKQTMAKIEDCDGNIKQQAISLASSLLGLAHSAIVITAVAGTAALAGAAMGTGIGAGVLAGIGIAYLVWRKRKAIASFVKDKVQTIGTHMSNLSSNIAKGLDIVKNQIRSVVSARIRDVARAAEQPQNLPPSNTSADRAARASVVDALSAAIGLTV